MHAKPPSAKPTVHNAAWGSGRKRLGYSTLAVHDIMFIRWRSGWLLCVFGHYPACPWGRIPAVWGRWRGRDIRHPQCPASAVERPSDTRSPDSGKGYPSQWESWTEKRKRVTVTENLIHTKNCCWLWPCRGQCHCIAFSDDTVMENCQTKASHNPNDLYSNRKSNNALTRDRKCFLFTFFLPPLSFQTICLI